jgi:Protein of unknown function (DUF4238)
MSKRRQHYVPILYLKAFQSAPRRINICHLTTLRSFRDVSLRKQCYLHRFYGSVELEDSIRELVEDPAAPVLRAICDSGVPPSLGSKGHAALLTFVGFQALRTPTTRKNIKDTCVKFDDQVFGDTEPDPDSGLSRFSPVSEAEALELQWKQVPFFVQALADLRLYVGSTSLKDRLITSDNPLIKYNSYCKGIRYWGSLGAKCRGLQIFLPLSPRVLLLLYDASVYKVGDEESVQSSSGRISKRDVDHLNAVQIFNANDCVYFSDWAQGGAVEHLAREYTPKKTDVMMINEGELIGSDNSTIVHMWEQQHELPFTMPLSQLRFQASKVQLKDRVNLSRTP